MTRQPPLERSPRSPTGLAVSTAPIVPSPRSSPFARGGPILARLSACVPNLRANALALALLAGTACAIHDPAPAFRGAVAIGDRGISVPLPPPSLLDAPHQEVEVHGELGGVDAVAAGTVIRVEDNRGDARTEVVLGADQTSFEVLLEIDLTDNCLEFRAVAPSGEEGQSTVFFAQATAPATIEVVAGCEE